MSKISNSIAHFIVLYIIIQSTLVFNFFNIKYHAYFFMIFVMLLALSTKKIRLMPLCFVLLFCVAVSINAYFVLDANSMGWSSATRLIVVIITSYSAISYLGKRFFQIYEKIVLVMSVGSIPFYIIYMLRPNILAIVSRFFRPITSAWYIDIGGTNLVLYSYLPEMFPRNSGFMWEPGVFAMVLIVAQIIRLIRNNGEIDIPIIIYIALTATTMSTMGYIANIFLIGSAILFSKNIAAWAKLFLIVLLIFSMPTLLYLSFILPKLERYFAGIGSGAYSSAHGTLYQSRFGYFYQVVKYIAQNPFGIGWHSSLLTEDYDNIYGVGVGVGTISEWLLRWGFVGIIFIVSLLHRGINSMNNKKNSSIIYSLSLLMALFSNPAALMYWPFCFIFYVFTHDFIMDKK